MHAKKLLIERQFGPKVCNPLNSDNYGAYNSYRIYPKHPEHKSMSPVPNVKIHKIIKESKRKSPLVVKHSNGGGNIFPVSRNDDLGVLHSYKF